MPRAVIPGCQTTGLGEHVDDSVLAEVLPLIQTAVSSLPELREVLERPWAVLSKPVSIQDEMRERSRQQLGREAKQARFSLTKAAVLFADGDIDQPGYELRCDKALWDVDVMSNFASIAGTRRGGGDQKVQEVGQWASC